MNFISSKEGNRTDVKSDERANKLDTIFWGHIDVEKYSNSLSDGCFTHRCYECMARYESGLEQADYCFVASD